MRFLFGLEDEKKKMGPYIVIYVFVVKYVYMSLLQPHFIVWDFALALLGKNKTLYTGTWNCTLQANNIHHLPVNTFSAIFLTTYKVFWE